MEMDRNVRAGAQAAMSLNNDPDSIAGSSSRRPRTPEDLTVDVDMQCRCAGAPADCATPVRGRDRAGGLRGDQRAAALRGHHLARADAHLANPRPDPVRQPMTPPTPLRTPDSAATPSARWPATASGVTSIEFAMVIGLIIMGVVATLEFGRALGGAERDEPRPGAGGARGEPQQHDDHREITELSKAISTTTTGGSSTSASPKSPGRASWRSQSSFPLRCRFR